MLNESSLSFRACGSRRGSPDRLAAEVSAAAADAVSLVSYLASHVCEIVSDNWLTSRPATSPKTSRWTSVSSGTGEYVYLRLGSTRWRSRLNGPKPGQKP